MYEFTEGSVTIDVPEYEIQTSRNEVFYNPVMEFNRNFNPTNPLPATRTRYIMWHGRNGSKGASIRA